MICKSLLTIIEIITTSTKSPEHFKVVFILRLSPILTIMTKLLEFGIYRSYLRNWINKSNWKIWISSSW